MVSLYALRYWVSWMGLLHTVDSLGSVAIAYGGSYPIPGYDAHSSSGRRPFGAFVVATNRSPGSPRARRLGRKVEAGRDRRWRARGLATEEWKELRREVKALRQGKEVHRAVIAWGSSR